MKFGFSRREQQTIVLAGALGVLVIWGYSAYIIGPLMRETVKLGQDIVGARQELKLLEGVTANEATLREQQKQLNRSVDSLRSLLPDEEEIPAVIERLSEVARQTGVKIQAIFPQRPMDTPESGGKGKSASLYYKEIPIQIDALAGYHQLGAFLSQVEFSDRPMQIASLRITGSQKEPKRHNVKLLVRSYFAVNVDVTTPSRTAATSTPGS